MNSFINNNKGEPYEYPIMITIAVLSFCITSFLFILSQCQNTQFDEKSTIQFLMINVLIASTLDTIVQPLILHPDDITSLICIVQGRVKLFSIISEEFWVISINLYCFISIKGSNIMNSDSITKKLIYFAINMGIPIISVEIVQICGLFGHRTYFCWLQHSKDNKIYYDIYTYFVSISTIICIILIILTFIQLKKKILEKKMQKTLILRMLIFPFIQLVRIVFYILRYCIELGSTFHFFSLCLRSCSALMYGLCFALNVDSINRMCCRKKQEERSKIEEASVTYSSFEDEEF